jgi:hypothetical protein
MIPADSWHDNGDGTAWLVDDRRFVPNAGAWWGDLDRPCDTCGGWGELEDDHPVYGAAMGADCPDCDGTGRHTFTIEVDNVDTVDEFIEHGNCRSYRVAVVTGMVLPIAAMDNEGECGFADNEDHVCVAPNRIGGIDGVDHVAYVNGTSDYITLPPAAKPGMWAVKVRTQPENVEEPK